MSATRELPKKDRIIRRTQAGGFVSTGLGLNQAQARARALCNESRTAIAQPVHKLTKTTPAPSPKHKMTSARGSCSVSNRAPWVLYYPSKSEYEPVHESIPVYYELPGEEVSRGDYEEPAVNHIDTFYGTQEVKKEATAKQPTIRAKCVYPKNKNTHDGQYKCLKCDLPLTPWQRYIRCSGYPPNVT